MSSNEARLKQYSLWTAAAVFLVALITFAGWMLSMPRLTTFMITASTMKVNTAVALMLAAASLALLNREHSEAAARTARILAVPVVIIGLLTLAQYLFRFDAGIDRLLVAPPPDPPNPFSGRMSPLTAVCLICAGVALLALDRHPDVTFPAAELATVIMILVAMLGLVGYAYGASELYRIGRYSPLAIHTSLSFLALGSGILAARPDRGLVAMLARHTAGSMLARRLLTAAILIPLAFGWLRVMGEQAGLYDMPFGTALLVTSLITAFVALIWWTATSIDRSDTERKQAEDALLTSEESFSTMFRSLPVAAALARYSDTTIVDCNDAFVALTGFSADEVVGKNSAELGLIRDETRRNETLDTVRRQGEIRNIELKCFPKHGEPRDIVTNVNVIELAGTKYVLSSLADITERKRAEEALRRTTQFDEAVMTNMGEGLYTVNSAGLVTFMNPMAQKLFGWTLDELRGRKMHDVTHYKHRDGTPFPAELCAGLQVLREGRTLSDHEDVFIRKDGSFFDVVYSSSAFREEGQITGLVVVFRDITERKRAEEALRDSERRFKEAAAAAESANHLKDEFLATLSHELRTPLNAILGYTRMLRTGAIPSDKRGRALETIERNAAVQNQLVEDLLDISRITTGRVRLEMQHVPIMGPLLEAIESTRPTGDTKQVTLDVRADPFAGTVRADPARLQQVFWNLLSNAVKFTPAGGRVAVNLESDDEFVTVTVRDTGIGIPEEFLPHVFEPFRQADGGFSREFGGLGLGLAICRQLIDLHGGNLDAESAGPGLGATFSVRLPRHPASIKDAVGSPNVADTLALSSAERTLLEAAPSTGARLEGLNVLVVDDEEDSLELLRQLLENAGASVRTASNGPEALREIDRQTPQLLVADLGLPQMDGYQLLREVRKRPHTNGGSIAAVAVTAYARLDDRYRALAAGFHDHITKPIDPDTFLSALAAAVERR